MLVISFSAYRDSHDQTCHQRSSSGQALDVHVFMKGMGTIADRAQTIESWNPERRSEISVRSAAGAAFGQIVPEFPRNLPRLLVQTLHALGAFQRRTVEAT